MIIKRILVLFTVLLALFSFPQAYADIIKTKQVSNLVYFLSQSPNKIFVYDQAQSTFLNDIPLTNIPTSFTVLDEIVYVAYDRKLKKIHLADNTETFVRNSVKQIKELEVHNSILYVVDDEATVTPIDLKNNEPLTSISNHYSQYTYKGLSISAHRNEIFSVNGSSNSIDRIRLDSEGNIVDRSSSHPIISFFSDKLILDPYENRLLTADGKSYVASDISFLAKSPKFEQAAYAQSNLVTCFENKLTLFSPTYLRQKQFSLSERCDAITVYEKSVTVFSFLGANITISTFDIGSEQLLSVGLPIDPYSYNYQYDLIEVGEDNIVYLYDRETLHIHRWSLKSQSYLSSYILRNPIKAMMHVLSPNRIYLQYSPNTINYIDIGDPELNEQSFLSATLMAASDSLVFTHNITGVTSWGLDGSKLSHIEMFLFGPYELKAGSWDAANSEITLINYHSSQKNLATTYPITLDGVVGERRTIGIPVSSSNPLLIDENLDLVIYENGQIFSLVDGSEQGVLSSDIRSAAWVVGKLVTINEAGEEIQFWSDKYELESSLPLAGSHNAEVFLVDHKLLLVRQSQSPEFEHFDINRIPDSDKDGLHDLEDNCRLEPNPDQFDTDLDLEGDACDSDDDNDGLPDTVELVSGLNPLDPLDAMSDLDQDGFSNSIEYLQNSDLSDAASLPTKLTAFIEGFENGWPAAFYVRDSYDWQLLSSSNGSRLESKVLTKSGDTSSVFLGAYVAPGFLTFKSNRDVNNYVSFNVYVNGEKAELDTSYLSSDEDLYSLSLSEGAYLIEFRVTQTSYLSGDKRFIDDLAFVVDSDSDGIADYTDNCPAISNQWQYDHDGDGKGDECDNTPWGNDRDNDDVSDWTDNCPDIYNPNQADLDSDGQGDACDNTDDRPQDHDNDGFYGPADNCPLVYNPDQNNLDQDYYGDACDTDIDGDGISNELESENGLNSRDASDAFADLDGDGVTNIYELEHGSDLSKPEDFEAIDLSDYYPLGRVSYVYTSYYGESIELEISSGAKSGQYIFKIGSLNMIAENRQDGVYMVEITSSTSSRIMTCDNYLMLPRSMKLGEYKKTLATCITKEGEEIVQNEDFETDFYLKAKTEIPWQSNLYDALLIGSVSSEIDDYFLLKGVGSLTYGNGTYLASIDAESIDSPAPFYDAEKKDDSDGIGSQSIPFLVMLAVLSLARIQRRKLRTY